MGSAQGEAAAQAQLPPGGPPPQVLFDISGSVRPGEVMALMGEGPGGRFAAQGRHRHSTALHSTALHSTAAPRLGREPAPFVSLRFEGHQRTLTGNHESKST